MSSSPPETDVRTRPQAALRADRAERLLREAEAIESALDIIPSQDDA